MGDGKSLRLSSLVSTGPYPPLQDARRNEGERSALRSSMRCEFIADTSS
jgi:hypothetical protein